MSNIFEALRKGQGDISEVIIPALTQDPAATQEQEPSPSAETAAIILELTGQNNESLHPNPNPEVRSNHSTTGRRVLPLQIQQSAPLLPFDQTNWHAGEQYRIVRTKILHHPSRPRMIVVSSATPRDGKTVTTINVAGAMALKCPTLLVDADFRKPTLATSLGLPSSPGLSDVLAGTADLEDALIRAQQISNLYVIPCGKSRVNPTELLDSPKWESFCASCRKMFDFIFLDSPPIAAVADCDLLIAAADGVILVAQPDHTNRRLLFKALEVIPNEKLIGVVINGIKPWLFQKQDQQYYYSYSESGETL